MSHVELPERFRYRTTWLDAVKTSSLTAFLTDHSVSLGLGIIAYLVAIFVPPLENHAAAAAGVVLFVSWFSEVVVRKRIGDADHIRADIAAANRRIEELEAKLLGDDEKLDLYVDPEAYGTLSPTMSERTHLKELGVWQATLVNRSHETMDLRFRVHLVIEGRASSGEWLRRKPWLRNAPESYWWKHETPPIGRKLTLAPGESTEAGFWILFVLPAGEEAVATNNYTSMRDRLTLEIIDDVTRRSRFHGLQVWLDDWPRLPLNPPPQRDSDADCNPGENPDEP